MTSRDLVLKALNHQPTPRAPRDFWLAAELETARPDDLAEMNLRFPSDIVAVEARPLPGKRAAKTPREGTILDAWGCSWAPGKPGSLDEAKDPPLSDATKISGFETPRELHDRARFAKVAKAIEGASRFVLGQSDVRLFERIVGLRGQKAAILDLARGTKDIRKLLAQVHESNCRELEMWTGIDVDGVAIRDIWGADGALLLAPAMWREIFKPLYRDYCQILHGKDKFVFLVSGGNVADILSDLVRIEVDAIHSQWSAMNFERVVKRFRGQITFWGGVDRPELLGAAGADEVRQAVQRVREALDYGAGGVIAQCRWDLATPLASVVAFCEQWMTPMPMHAA